MRAEFIGLESERVASRAKSSEEGRIWTCVIEMGTRNVEQDIILASPFRSWHTTHLIAVRDIGRLDEQLRKLIHQTFLHACCGNVNRLQALLYGQLCIGVEVVTDKE